MSFENPPPPPPPPPPAGGGYPPPPPPAHGEPEPLPAHVEHEWKRRARHREKVVALVMVPLLLALIVATAVGGSDDDDEPIAAVSPTSESSDSPSPGDPSCVVLVGNGAKDTEKVLADLEQPCLGEDGELITVRTESYACFDGSVLHVNDLGRGYDSSAWRPDDFAPDAFEIERCTGETTTTTTTETATTATTAPPTTTTTAPPSVLVYEVGGSGSALVTYSVDGFSQEQKDVTLPWRHEIPEAEAPEFPTLVAQIHGSGEITCRISWNTGTAALAEASSAGDYVVVTCG